VDGNKKRHLIALPHLAGNGLDIDANFGLPLTAAGDE
jgi:hypothetical protein